MQVDPNTAPASSTYAGQTYYFCCPGCKKKFDATGYDRPEFIDKPVDAELCRWACAVAKRDYNRFLGELSAFVLGREAPPAPAPPRQVTD